MPDFPDKYPTSALIGRVDVTGVLHHDEFLDRVPKLLQEPTESDYHFVCRNP